MKTLLRLAPALLVVILFGGDVVGISIPKKDKIGDFQYHEFGRLPVLLNGRIQPFDSVARNSLLQLRSTGELPLEEVPSWKFWHHAKKLKPSEWLLEVMAKPEVADTRHAFLIHHPELLGELKLQDKGIEKSGLRYYTFNDLRPVVPEILKQARPILKREEEKTSKSENRTTFEKQLMKLFNAVNLYDRLKVTLQPGDTQDFVKELAEFRQNLGPARLAAQASETSTNIDQEAILKVKGPLADFQNMADWGYALIIPPLEPERGRDHWENAGTSLLESARANVYHPAITNFAAMATAYHNDDPETFNRAVANYKAWLAPNFEKELKKGRAEFYFNNMKPFFHAMMIYLFAFVVGGVALLTFGTFPDFSEASRRTAYYAILLAGCVHTFGLIFRMVLEGRPPVTNLYSSAIFIGWGTTVLGIILERIYRVGIGNLVASCAGFITLLIAHNLAIGGDTMEMLRAVLDTNFWLATHVVAVTVGYASTFVGGLLGIIYIGLGVFTPMLNQKLGARGEVGLVVAGAAAGGVVGAAAAGVVAATARRNDLNIGKALAKMIYGIVCFATLFSFVGTVLGGIWADQSWGRFWGWDPKENGALLIVLWNAIILHARWGGMVRDRGIANLAVFGNIITSFSWFGVNMLGIGLHSYGFMDEAFNWLILFVGSQVAIIAIGLIPLRHWCSFRASAPQPPPIPPSAAAAKA
jgi:cytochrome c-type biogenesis protein CcsB